MPSRRFRRAAGLACVCALLAGPGSRAFGRAAGELPADRGAAGTWQKLLKLRTTASAMHTTAHPDDEHGGLLARLSRGQGVRMALLTLNRGESGDNAIGPELFDGLGLIRTEELLVADRYYGVDDQYFTPFVDYGFSKRLDEALEKWGREDLLREVVRVVRIDRPLVLIARFQGNSRDGHGHHQAAGLVTQEAFRAAGDPAMFPEHAAEGLRPWQPLKLYVGGVRESEDWTIRTDAGQYSPWLGESYGNFARIGLSFQRSQNGGQLNLTPGSSYGYYRRLILAPRHPVLRRPNAITLADFDGWVEQRGSKFFASWDPAYTALIATHDKGQEPQKGGWVTARYGKGHYTYFAYALHRQLPYGVPGAYRLLANLLSLGRGAGPPGGPSATRPSGRPGLY